MFATHDVGDTGDKRKLPHKVQATEGVRAAAAPCLEDSKAAKMLSQSLASVITITKSWPCKEGVFQRKRRLGWLVVINNKSKKASTSPERQGVD